MGSRSSSRSAMSSILTTYWEGESTLGNGKRGAAAVFRFVFIGASTRTRQ